MCDTLIAMPETTADNSVLFAKNSDREPNEAQNITYVPASTHKKHSRVRCTYIEIPQVQKTQAVLLSRPFWMFGAEMGVNDHGVVIGNEAVFTKEKYIKNETLTGMDILRLALERSKSAIEAMNTIISLIDQYGQGGNCGMDNPLFYHNSFVIADCRESFILETADKHWVAKRITTFGAISNCLTIGEDFDMSSKGIEDYALRKKYLKKGEIFNFATAFSDTLYTYFARGKDRVRCSLERLRNSDGKITTPLMISHLRDHNREDEYIVGKKPMRGICLHAGGLVSTQTTGSMVVKLKKNHEPLIYVTGTSAPCLSIYKPMSIPEHNTSDLTNTYSSSIDDGSTDVFGTSTKQYSRNTLWWKGEEIHRRVIINYPYYSEKWIAKVRPEESKIIEETEKAWMTASKNKMKKIVLKKTQDFLEFYNKSITEFITEFKKKKQSMTLISALQWRKNNRKAGIQI